MNGLPLKWQSAFWVAAQFLLLFLLVPGSAPWHWQPVATGLMAAGAALALWVFAHNRPGNFNIRPEPKSGARLVTTGPYRFVRHPMYVALLLATAGLVAASSQTGLWVLWGLLWGVLNFKAALEERLLTAHWAEYARYCASVSRFIPGLW